MTTRRYFITRFLGGLGLLTLLSQTGLQAQEERRRSRPSGSGQPPLLDPADPTAKALNYVHSKKDLKKAEVKIEKQGVKWEEQFCRNCQLYSNPTQRAGEEVGPCTLFQGKVVKGQGWCSSWAKKV